MSKLVIVVPAGRHRCGRALLLGSDGATRAGPVRVLATASAWMARRRANPERDWRKPFGHTPTGSYVVSASLPPGAAPRPARIRRFGPLGALVLTPTDGDALDAAKAGRRRFLIHGGPTDRRGRLRPTFGGLRLRDRDLRTLLAAVNDANGAADPVSSVEVVETIERPPWSDQGPRDRAGRLRPGSRTRRKGAPSMPLGHAALVALGFGIAGTGLKVDATPGRRGFVALALLTLGALGSTACGPDDPAAESDGTDGGRSPCCDEPVPDVDGRARANPTVADGGPEGGPGGGAPSGSGDDGGGAQGGYASSGCGGGIEYGGGGDLGGDGTGDGTGDDSSGGAG